MNEPLQFVSNMIELKPDKKYLLVFSGGTLNIEGLQEVLAKLHAQGIQGIGIALYKGQELQVIEVPA